MANVDHIPAYLTGMRDLMDRGEAPLFNQPRAFPAL